MKTLLDKLKYVGELLWKNTLAKMILAGIFVIVGGIMSPYGTIGQYIDYEPGITFWEILMYIGAAYLAIMTLLFTIFAWIINPIRDYRAKKKNKK